MTVPLYNVRTFSESATAFLPCFQTEIAPPKIRGFLVGLTQEMLGIGFVVANWVGCFIVPLDFHSLLA